MIVVNPKKKKTKNFVVCTILGDMPDSLGEGTKTNYMYGTVRVLLSPMS